MHQDFSALYCHNTSLTPFISAIATQRQKNQGRGGRGGGVCERGRGMEEEEDDDDGEWGIMEHN